MNLLLTKFVGLPDKITVDTVADSLGDRPAPYPRSSMRYSS